MFGAHSGEYSGEHSGEHYGVHSGAHRCEHFVNIQLYILVSFVSENATMREGRIAKEDIWCTARGADGDNKEESENYQQRVATGPICDTIYG